MAARLNGAARRVWDFSFGGVLFCGAGDFKSALLKDPSAVLASSCALSDSLVSSAAFGVRSPRDAASGLATGKRQHKPLVITMELSRSTPALMQEFDKPSEGGAAALVCAWACE